MPGALLGASWHRSRPKAAPSSRGSHLLSLSLGLGPLPAVARVREGAAPEGPSPELVVQEQLARAARVLRLSCPSSV